jgi:hypothetical protein
MKGILVIYFVFTIVDVSGQISISPGYFDSINLGRDTKYDLEGKWYHGLFQYTDNRDDGTNFYTSDSLNCNFLVNNEIIDAVSLNKGFYGVFNDSIKIKINTSKFSDFRSIINNNSTEIYPVYDKIRIISGCFKIYLQNKDAILKENYLLNDLEELTIIRIVVSDFCLPNLPDCYPIYAPDSVYHCNETICKHPFTLSPFARPKQIPIGYWKRYYPNHKLKEEGEYNSKGKKVGIWKYYDLDGILIITKAYNKT